jgi:hypothetical protein
MNSKAVCHITIIEKPIDFDEILRFLTGQNIEMTPDKDNEKYNRLHQCAQCDCIIECPAYKCNFNTKSFRVDQCKLCQGYCTDAWKESTT